jgi:hypothetical protein
MISLIGRRLCLSRHSKGSAKSIRGGPHSEIWPVLFPARALQSLAMIDLLDAFILTVPSLLYRIRRFPIHPRKCSVFVESPFCSCQSLTVTINHFARFAFVKVDRDSWPEQHHIHWSSCLVLSGGSHREVWESCSAKCLMLVQKSMRRCQKSTLMTARDNPEKSNPDQRDSTPIRFRPAKAPDIPRNTVSQCLRQPKGSKLMTVTDNPGMRTFRYGQAL